MPVDHLQTLIYSSVAAISILLYLTWRRRTSAIATRRLSEARDDGLTEPPTLHPVIDTGLCMGCGSCVTACPEGTILGLVNGRAQLVEPTSCIGHGACRAACPFDAISLVFGTERRGVDIPNVDTRFESNVPGLFIAGEVGGMGLIRNAIEQGRQAAEEIVSDNPARNGRPVLDVIVVGAGPAGIAAALVFKERGVTFEVLEQESIGGTIAHFPRGKIVMTAPAKLPFVGKFRFRETTKEVMMKFWADIISKAGLVIRTGVRVTGVIPLDGHFEVETENETLRTRRILLACGRRGTPRKLNVPGEELCKVVYRLTDAAQYRGRRVLAVGGGDAALEAATTIAQQPDTSVILAYRGKTFGRAKKKNRDMVASLVKDGRLEVRYETQVGQIEARRVSLKRGQEERWVDNDAVIICAGGVLPTSFLRSIGVEVETRFGTA